MGKGGSFMKIFRLMFRKGAYWACWGKNRDRQNHNNQYSHGIFETIVWRMPDLWRRCHPTKSRHARKNRVAIGRTCPIFFMTIEQIEKFYSAFYRKWNRAAYYELMRKLQVSPGQKNCKYVVRTAFASGFGVDFGAECGFACA